jgi:hypothetical protein
VHEKVRPRPFPVLPLVRAILSWQIVPDPSSPDRKPIWGDVHEFHGQIRPGRLVLSDVAAQLPQDLVHQLPPYLLQEPSPNPDPGPQAPLALAELTALYASRGRATVPQHRFALPHLESARALPGLTLQSFVGPAQEAKVVEVTLAEILAQLEKTSGDTTFAELECLGVDSNTDHVVGTFRVKRGSGFFGGPCTAGSTEYIAY